MPDPRLDLSFFSSGKLYCLAQKKEDPTQNAQNTQHVAQANFSGIVWTKTAENNSIENPNKKTDNKNPLKIKSTDKPQISAVEAVDQVLISSAISSIDPESNFSKETNPQEQQVTAELARVYAESKSHNSVYERFKGVLSLAAVKARALFNGVSFKEQGEILAQVRQNKLREIDEKVRNEYGHTRALFEITQG